MSSKRKRDGSDNSLEVLSEGGQGFAESSKSVFDRQRRLHGFLLAELSDRVSQYPGDMLLTRRVGVETLGKFVQVVASRLLCVGRTTELLGAKQQVDVDKFAPLERIIKEKEGVIVDVTAKMKEKKEAVSDITVKMKEKEDEVTRLQDQIRLLQSEIRESDKTKGEMTARIHELEDQGIEMFTSGFGRVVSQISLFAPKFDIGQLDVTKIVIDEKLVQDEASEDHDENVPPPI